MVRLKALVVQSAGIATVTIALLEGIVAFSFAHPAVSLLPKPLLRNLHQRFDRNAIQVLPSCARYDAYVTYLLRPGTCLFENREFSTTYRINALGLRDDEASIEHPAVVVLGDSVTMGWGVEQEEAFPAVYESLTGRRTLNAGVSSFGTVRELRLLQRIDRSRLEDLIIQYTDNDIVENQTFVDVGDLRTLSASEYQRTVDEQASVMHYVPGKYSLNVLIQFQSAIRRYALGASGSRDRKDETWQHQAQLFLKVLQGSPVDLSKTSVTVLSLHSEFISALRDQAPKSPLPWIATAKLVDGGVATTFPGAFFVLDDHPTAAGQIAVGRLLADILPGPTQ